MLLLLCFLLNELLIEFVVEKLYGLIKSKFVPCALVFLRVKTKINLLVMASKILVKIYRPSVLWHLGVYFIA